MTHKRWSLRPRDLVGINPVKARNLISECFFESEKDVYAQANLHGRKPTEAEIRRLVEGTVRRAFDEAGFDYARPDKRALQAVVNVLMRKAASWKTPPELIAHHREEIGRILAHLS